MRFRRAFFSLLEELSEDSFSVGVHQQVFAVHAEIHYPWCRSCHSLFTEALRHLAVSTSQQKHPHHVTVYKIPTMALRLRDFVFPSPPARALSAENPDLVQLKSLLAGLTLPVKRSSAEVAPEERDGKHRSILWVRACLWTNQFLRVISQHALMNQSPACSSTELRLISQQTVCLTSPLFNIHDTFFLTLRPACISCYTQKSMKFFFSWFPSNSNFTPCLFLLS